MNPTSSLIDAIKAGDDVRLKELLAANPGLANTRNEQGETPILAAAYRLRTDVIQLLLHAGAETDIHEASAVGQLDRVRAFTTANPKLVNSWSQDGFTPLGLASFFGHKEIVAFLVASGAEVNVVSRNDFKVMPLHSAASARHTEVAEILLEHGAAVNATQEAGYTPLHSAANNGQEEMVRLLLAHGADVNARSHDGITPLQLAVERDHDAVAELLRKSGAQP